MDVDADVLVIDIAARIHRGGVERRKAAAAKFSAACAGVLHREWRW